MIAALPLLVGFPGYALVAVLFPAAAEPVDDDGYRAGRSRGVSTAERLALSVGVSIAVLPLVVIGLGVLPWSITGSSVTTAVTGLIGASSLVGMWRRLRLPVSSRFAVRPLYWTTQLVDDRNDLRTTASVLLLVVTIGLAGGALTYAIVTPTAGATYSEIALYGEDENGSTEIGAVPEAVEPEGEIPITVELTNEHRESRSYTVVVQTHTVTTGTVTERSAVTDLQYDLGPGESGRESTTVVPGVGVDETVRVVALMYETDDGAVPTDPTIENADEYVYFHTHVTDDPDGDDTIVVDG